MHTLIQTHTHSLPWHWWALPNQPAPCWTSTLATKPDPLQSTCLKQQHPLQMKTEVEETKLLYCPRITTSCHLSPLPIMFWGERLPNYPSRTAVCEAKWSWANNFLIGSAAHSPLLRRFSVGKRKRGKKPDSLINNFLTHFFIHLLGSLSGARLREVRREHEKGKLKMCTCSQR